MSPDDALHEALANLETPEIDVDRALGQVHRKARRARVLRFGGPVAAVLLVVTVSVAVVANRSGGGGLAVVHVVSAAVPRDPSDPCTVRRRRRRGERLLDRPLQAGRRPPSRETWCCLRTASTRCCRWRWPEHGAARTTRSPRCSTPVRTRPTTTRRSTPLDRQLAAPRTGEPGSSDPEHPGTTLPATPPVALHVADSVWVQRGFAVETGVPRSARPLLRRRGAHRRLRPPRPRRAAGRSTPG